MDIRIVKLRDRAFISPISSKGDEWLRNNMYYLNTKSGEIAVTVNEEHVFDVAKEMTDMGLIVDMK